MKAVDTSTVGGRIRSCRRALNLTLDGMAKQIGISSNYVSIIERGVKIPSDNILIKVAELANVPFEWLKTGEEDNTATTANVQAPLPLAAVPVGINVPLFLSLVVQSIPDMTKDKLAAKLDVSPDVMDNILSSNDYKSAPHWADYFSILARQMDLPAVRQKIRALDLFLQHENTEKMKKNLYDSLRSYAGSEYQYFVPDSMRRKDADVPTDPDILYSEHIVLQKEESPCSGSWHFIFLRFANIDESLAESVMGSQLSYCEDIDGNLTLVFDDEATLDLFAKDYEERQNKVDALAGTPYDGDHSLPPISMLLVDKETWEARGELIRLGDDGQ